jgi:tRNA U34 5-carboxymethylaminomethyl modifying GTPase MnmE/TrmE
MRLAPLRPTSIHELAQSIERGFGKVYRVCWGFVDRVYPEDFEPSPLDREAIQQDAYAASRASVYVRRQDYFDRLDTHAAGDGPLLVITGESGAGKSSLLANWTSEYRPVPATLPRST